MHAIYTYYPHLRVSTFLMLPTEKMNEPCKPCHVHDVGQRKLIKYIKALHPHWVNTSLWTKAIFDTLGCTTIEL